MRKPRIQCRSQDGFSLVEAMVALIIFGVGAIALMQLAPAGMRYANHGRLLSEANGLAQAKVEELRALPSTDPELQAGNYDDPDNPIDGAFTRSWEITDDDPMEGMKRVEVRVVLSTSSSDSVTTLVTYF